MVSSTGVTSRGSLTGASSAAGCSMSVRMSTGVNEVTYQDMLPSSLLAGSW